MLRGIPHDRDNYQLHFSYTWMKAIHTYTHEYESQSEVAEWDLHGLAGFTKGGDIKVITWPLIVILIGKFFVHKSGYSTWTGYEMFVSDRLEVWMIYVPTEDDAITWNTVDTGLFAGYGDQSDQTGKCKLVRFCGSLRDLKTATFEAVQKEAIMAREPFFTNFYLLELSASDIQNFVNPRPCTKSSDNLEWERFGLEECIRLRSENITLGYSIAYHQLLLLAKEHSEKCFVRFSLDFNSRNPCERDEKGNTSLLVKAVYSESWRIVDMIFASGNVDAFANKGDFSNMAILARADQSGSEALVKFISDRIQPNPPDEDGEPLITKAIRTKESRPMKLLLDTGKVNIDQQDRGRQTPLVVARACVKVLETLEKDEEESRRLNTDREEMVRRLKNLHETVRMLENYSK
ncbi:hypothetical protein GGR58DRAFT_464579 [Xylaria digitata]|nr:hypothetical protein GGR58DRAFT_464579 [Xylaria digitata]